MKGSFLRTSDAHKLPVQIFHGSGCLGDYYVVMNSIFTRRVERNKEKWRKVKKSKKMKRLKKGKKQIKRIDENLLKWHRCFGPVALSDASLPGSVAGLLARHIFENDSKNNNSKHNKVLVDFFVDQYRNKKYHQKN